MIDNAEYLRHVQALLSINDINRFISRKPYDFEVDQNVLYPREKAIIGDKEYGNFHDCNINKGERKIHDEEIKLSLSEEKLFFIGSTQAPTTPQME